MTQPPAAVSSHLSPPQQQLALLWAEVLHIDVEDIRASDNFFDLGGDSLLALRAIRTAEERLGQRVQARRYVFENLGQLAAEPVTASPSATAGAEPTTRSPATAPAERTGLLARLFGRRKTH